MHRLYEQEVDILELKQTYQYRTGQAWAALL